MFSNKAMLVQSTLSKQPWQLCYFARLMPAISKAFLGTLLETGFKHQLKRPLCRSSSLLLNCRRWHAVLHCIPLLEHPSHAAEHTARA